MATIYSLICFGGKDGKTVTFTDAGDVVNLTNHGLRDGTGVVFTDNAGNTLPTGLSKNTTYYAKSTGANTFTLYTTNGLVTQVTFTGTGTGTHKVKSAYYYNLADKSRWTYSGTEYIFDSLSAWKTTRNAATNGFDSEVAEIGMDWTEVSTGSVTFELTNCPSTTITSSIDGVRTSAFHNGQMLAGYIWQTNTSGLQSTGKFTTIDGITFQTVSLTSQGLTVTALSVTIKNCIIVGYNNANGNGITIDSVANGCYVLNNVVRNCQYGIVNNGAQYSTIANNTVVGCGTGFYPSSGSLSFRYGRWINNISVGNTTNWHTAPSSLEYATNNSGAAADATQPWTTTGGVHYDVETTDFVDYANYNYRPALITSPQVERGATYYGVQTLDIVEEPSPSYPGSAYNTAVTAGSFVAGLSYTITTKGTTDFTACGATTNAVTFTDAGDTVGWTAHTLNNGDLIYFSVITTTTGISIDTLYYVVGKAANTFQVSLTSGGSAIALTTNGTGTVVLPTFKATGVGSGTGTATLNAKYDIGAYEYDLGYGDWPQTQEVTISGVITGSRVLIEKTDGTEIYNTDSPSWPQTTSYTVDTDVNVVIRKASSATYYQPITLTGTIDPVAGLTLSASGLQVEDIAASTYDAGVAADWTVNFTTGAIAHTSGTTRYSVRDLYSYHQNLTDDSGNMSADPLMHGTTPTMFELINTGSITTGDLEDLYGGSIELTDGSIYANVYSVGGLTGSPDIYLYQDTTKVTSFWSAGHIDILLKTANAGGSLVSSGLIDGYARKWGYTYDNYQTNCSGAGRNVMPLATLADSNITDTEVTVGGWTDVIFTFGETSKDFGDGDGPQTYYLVINCNNRPLSEVYQRAQYIVRGGASGTVNSVAAETYQKAHSSYTPNKLAPFGTYSGGTWTLAQGIWLDNVPSSDSVNYILTDHAGNTHQNVLAPGAASATVLTGSRVQLYNVDTATEIDNVTNADTSYSYTITTEALEGQTLRLRVCKLGYEPVEVFGIFNAASGVQFLVTQTLDSIYATWGIDGSTVTEYTLDVTGNIEIDANDVDGVSTKTRLGAFYNYALTTADGIRSAFGAVTYLSTAAIRVNVDVIDLKIENVNPTTALTFTDLDVRLYRSDGTSIIAATSYSIHNDYSGVPDVVETGVSGLTAAESNQLMSLPNSTAIVSSIKSDPATLTVSKYLGLK